MLHVARFYVSSEETDGVEFEHLPYCSGVGLPKLEISALHPKRLWISKCSVIKITGPSKCLLIDYLNAGSPRVR